MNTSYNFTEWNMAEVKTWIENYITYHQIVRDAINEEFSTGSSSIEEDQILEEEQNSEEEYSYDELWSILPDLDETTLRAFFEFQKEIGNLMNETAWNDTLDFNSTWSPMFDQMNDANSILKELQKSHILWETFAFFDLFFGENNIFKREQELEQQEGEDSMDFEDENMDNSDMESDDNVDVDADGLLLGGFNLIQPSWSVLMGLNDRIRLYANTLIYEAIAPMLGTQ